MSAEVYSTRLLGEETWGDFSRLVDASNGVWGGCWCMAFHPEGFAAGSAEGNRLAKLDHVRAGSVRQVLVYDGDQVVGWCQFGPPSEVPNIKNLKAYQKAGAPVPDWRIGCIFTGSRHRGRGVARAAVARALEEIAAAGGGTVEAYPEQTDGRQPQRGAYLHTGPEELYASFGFERDRPIAKWRWVMRADVAPTAGR